MLHAQNVDADRSPAVLALMKRDRNAVHDLFGEVTYAADWIIIPEERPNARLGGGGRWLGLCAGADSPGTASKTISTHLLVSISRRGDSSCP